MSESKKEGETETEKRAEKREKREGVKGGEGKKREERRGKPMQRRIQYVMCRDRQLMRH